MALLLADTDVEGSRSKSVVDGADVRLPAPVRPEDLAAHYDLTISHPDVSTPQFVAFERSMMRETSDRGLSCALIHDGNVAEVIQRLAVGRLTVGYHLDYCALWHVRDDSYARLAQAIEDAGGQSVNSPARARAFTDKAAAGLELPRHGLGIPATLLVRPWSPIRPLTVVERSRVGFGEPGKCVYVKPANGFAGHGVVRVEGTEEALLAALTAARAREPDETLLIQREVCPPLLACEDGCVRPAYWRVLYQMGEVIPFWWAPQNRTGPAPSYRALTPAELRRHRLQGVLSYIRRLAELTGLEWFSTELCPSDGNEPSDFTVTTPDGQERPLVAIDPVNDQCDVDVQSRWAGAVPDDVVSRIAERFVERAWQLRQRALRPAMVRSYRVAA